MGLTFVARHDQEGSSSSLSLGKERRQQMNGNVWSSHGGVRMIG